MTLLSRRVPLSLALAGAALLAALLVIPWAVQAQSDPAAPGNLTAEVLDDGISLSWDAPTEQADAVTGYQILRRRPVQGENSLLALVDDTGSTATSYTDGTAAEAGVRYVYRVKARRGSELSGQSNYVNVQRPEEEEEDPPPTATPTPTPAPTPMPAVPAQPTGLTATSVSHDGVTLNWDDPDDASITHYQVLRRDRDADDPGAFDAIEDDTGSAATSYTDEEAKPAKRYVYRVVAVNGQGASPRSGYVNVETSDAPDIPAAPTGLSAPSVSHDSVTLSWDDPGDDSITGYQVLRRSRDGDEYGDGQGMAELVAIVDDTGSSATSYADTSVTARTRYVYSVRARNSAGLGEQSGHLNVETPAQPVPAKPTGLIVESYAHDSVTLVWDDPEDASITGYQVLRRSRDGKKYGDNKGPEELSVLADDTATSDTTYTDTSVTARTRYEYAVKARNLPGPSGRSDALPVETRPELTGRQVVIPDSEDDATLSGITVDGSAVPGFAADRDSYEYGIASATATVTVAATTTNSGASASITPADSDGVMPGHQVSLSPGRNTVTITVTAVDTTTTQEYTLNVNRGVTDAYGWKASDDIDTLAAASNTLSKASWANDTHVWVLDNEHDFVFAYNRDGTRDNSRDIDLHDDNSGPVGMTSDDTTMWVSDFRDEKLYAYNLDSRARDDAKDIETETHGNDSPAGIWTHGGIIWVVDEADLVFAYRTGDGTRVPEREFELGSVLGTSDAYSAWHDGVIAWVPLSLGSYTELRALNVADGSPDTSRDFTTLAGAGVRSVSAIWSDGTTMLVADNTNDKVYSFNMPSSANTGLREITVDGTTITGDLHGVESTTAQVTVAASAAHFKATAEVTAPTDSDTGTEGHQVALTTGAYTDVTITVTAQDGSAAAHTLKLYRGDLTTEFAWRVDDDIDTLVAAGNDSSVGIWSDGATMWVADATDAKIYAYRMSDKARDSGKDFDTLDAAGNDSPRGIWSDGATMWVVDTADDKIYAYGMSDQAHDSDKDFDTLAAADNSSPTGIWSDGATMWVADFNDDKIYAYRMSNKARDSGKDFDTLDSGNSSPTSIWSDGATMWVADLIRSKIYAYRMSDKARDSGKDFNILSAAGNDLPEGLWSDGATMRVADSIDDKIYSFNVPDSDNADLRAITVAEGAGDPYEIPGFTPGSTTSTLTTGGSTEQITVAGEPRQFEAMAEVTSPADADTTEDGHQVNTPVGETTVTLRVTAEDGATKDHTLTVTRPDISDDTSLSALTVGGISASDGDLIPFTSGTATATVVAEPSHAAATAEISPTDADDVASGHQVALTAGAYTDVTITVTAQDGSTNDTDFQLYRGDLATDFAWKVDDDFDTLAAVGSEPRFIWSDGATMWVADRTDDKLYAYQMSDKERDSSKDFNTLDAAGNTNPTGIWSDGATMWVADRTDDKIYAYQMSDKARDSSKDFNTLDAAGNESPTGIWSDGTTMWVGDGSDDKIYAYQMSDKARDSGKDFDTLDSGNSSPTGIWSDGATMWVSDLDDDKIYAYNLATKARDSGKDFNTLATAGNEGPTGIWSDGVTMWVSDSTDEKIYSYNYPSSDDTSLSALTVGGVAARNGDLVPFTSDTATVTVVAEPSHAVATAEISPADSDTGTEGHQLALTAGAYTDVTITVTAQDGSAAAHTLKLYRGDLATDFAWKVDDDFDTLKAAGNERGRGIWSDGATMWVADSIDDKIYAYRMSDKARDNGKDFDTLSAASNSGPSGLWSDGATMWVADHNVDKIYAYQMSDKARDSGKDFDTLDAAGNHASSGIWSDGTTMWVADRADAKIYAYRMSDKARDSDKDFNTLSAAGNGLPKGIWSDGATMRVADSIDDKIYAYRMSDKARDSGKDFNTLSAAGNDLPEGLWSDGATMRVADSIDDKIYSYNVPDSDNADLRAITVAEGAGDPYEIPGFTAGSTTSTLTTGGSTEQITIAGEPRQFEAMAEVTSPADADTTEDGHQVNTPVGETTVTLRVTAENGATKDHTLTVTRPEISDDPSLSSITVTPRDIIGFDPDRLSYHVGVANSVTQATINFTATVAVSTFRTTPDDADANTPGIQVNLSDGANPVTITVTAEDGNATRDYTVSVNRGVDTVFGWKAVDDLDGLIAAGNEYPIGIWTDGATIWVADLVDEKIYAYRMSDKARDSDKDFNTLSAAGNEHSRGIWSDGATMWVADSTDNKIYAYRMSDKARDDGKDFETLFAAGNTEPRGIWSDGATMWVADSADDKIYAYRMSDKARDDGKDFDTLSDAGNGTPRGIWSDGATMWVADFVGAKIYAYRMSDKAWDSGKDFNTLDAAGHATPTDISSDGVTMLATDPHNRDKVYSYNMPVSNNADLRTIELDGMEVGGFTPGTTTYTVEVDGDTTEVTVSAVPLQVKAEITEIRPADADAQTPGHQVAITSYETSVTFTVTAQGGAKKSYRVIVHNPSLSDPPVFLSYPDGSVDENTPPEDFIVRITATHPEGLTMGIVYTLDPASAEVFDIIRNTGGGVVRILTLAPLDYETTPSYQVTVTATDAGGASASVTITITVNNLNEPGSLDLSPSAGITGLPITATVDDPDGGVTGQTWEWYTGDSSSGPWTRITGAGAAAYTPADADIDKYLRVVARYRDTLGPGRTVEAITEQTVKSTDCIDEVRRCGLLNPAILEAGGSVRAQIDSRHDKDWFRFVMEPGKAYRIDMLGAETGDGTLADPYLHGLKAVYNVNDNQNDDPDDDVYVYVPDGLKDSEGDRFTSIWREWQDDTAHLRGTYYNDDGGQGYNARMFHRTHPSALLGTPQGYPEGVYYVEARGFGNSTGTYRMMLTEVTDDSTTPRLLTFGTPLPGTIDYPGDRDQFSIGLTANERLLFNASGAGILATAQLMESMEPEQDIKSTFTTSSLYHFTPPSTGQYLITVRGSETRRQHHGTGPYTLGAARDPEGQTLMADGSATNTSIGFTGDVDRFEVELDHSVDDSKTFRIDVKGLDSGDGTLPNPRILVRRKHGRVHRIYNDDGGMGSNARAYVTVDSEDRLPGDYFIEVNGKYRPGGTYVLTVAEAPTGHVWGSAMDPESHSGPNGFCAPIINGWCVVKQSGQRYGHLFDREFAIGTEDYEVLSIRYEPDPSDPKLHLTLDKALPSTDLGNLVFTVEGVDYQFSSATEGGSTDTGQNYYWSDVSTPPWTVSNSFSNNILVEINRTP